MSSDDSTIPPPVLWAQRSGAILLTISVEDCKNPDIKIDSDKLHFKSVGGIEKKNYEVTIPFYKEIDAEKSVTHVRERNIELVLKKKEDGPYWPQLTKEKNKYHWLKVDFNKWKDEDDSDEENTGGMDGGFDDLMRSMGGMGGEGDKPGFDMPGEDEEDSDDEDLPDLVQE